MSDSTAGLTRREALKRGITIGGAAMVWAAPTTQAFAMTIRDGEATSGAMGCTPGYWKNHQDLWVESTNPTLQQAFNCSSPGIDWGCIGVSPYSKAYGAHTILEALYFQGGDEVGEKLEIFFHHAAAAFLNMVFTPNYPINASNLEKEVCDVLMLCGTVDDETFVSRLLGSKNTLDAANNNGCPFNNEELDPIRNPFS